MSDTVSSPAAHPPAALPAGTRLGEFELRHVLGVGGFAIVYLAFDHTLEREVAVKEYMPTMLAGRTETLHVSLRSQSDADTFAVGLKSFVNEARLLARFDLPSLVRVHRFWEDNGTAYMAMPVVRGQSAKAWRQAQTRAPDEAWLRALLAPMLDTLEKLHAEAVYHRDIAPDNIQLDEDGRPVLLDLGAARRVIGDATQTLTAILKPAYAPIEQYAEVGALRQGAWTDLYALGATLHYLLLGRPPMPATARAVYDELPPLAGQTLPGCSRAFAQVVDWMLSPRPQDRPQSVAMLRDALQGRIAPPERAAEVLAAPVQWEPTQHRVSTPAAQHADAPAASASAADRPSAAARAADGDAAATVVHTGGPARSTAVAPATADGPAVDVAVDAAPPVQQAGVAAPARTVPSGRSRSPLWAGAALAVVLLGGAGAWWSGRDAGSAEDGAAAVAGAVPAASGVSGVSAAGSPATPAANGAAATGAPLLVVAAAAPDDQAAASAASDRAGSPLDGNAANGAAGAAAQSLTRAPAESAASPKTTTTPVRPPPRAAASPPPSPQRAAPVTRAGADAGMPPATPPAQTPEAALPVLGTPAPAAMPPAPAPQETAAAPAPRATPVLQGPTERCGRRVLMALWNCIERQCRLPELRSHPECVKLREDQERKVRGGL